MLWSTAHDTFLRACLAEGMSMASAAAALNFKFDTEYSRNACIGRAVRRDMPRNRSKPQTLRPKKPPERIEGKARRTWYRHKQIAEGRLPAPIRQPSAPKPDYVALRCVEVDPRHVSMIELELEQCRWPYGDSHPFTFCGHPASFGSYCGPHYALSIGQGTSSERSANRVLRSIG